MIAIQKLTKTFSSNGKSHTIIENLDAVFPSGRSIGLLGRNGAGKSSLLKLIAGTSRPTKGHVVSNGTISWPVGFAGSFNGDMSGAQNVKFVARIYGICTVRLTKFVEEFAELGKHYHMPFRTYSSGMRSRLAFGVSMGIPFDTYLIDEVTSVGDAGFRQKSEALLQDRLKDSGAIVVTHSMDLLRRLCTDAAVLENGKIEFFNSIDAGIEKHLSNMEKRGNQS